MTNGRSWYLSLYSAAIPTSNFERSLAFYTDVLGFRLLSRPTFPRTKAAAAIAPPDGTAILLLIEPTPELELTSPRGIAFVTDDITTCYADWVARGVRFADAPQSVAIGARHTIFFDLDDNAFSLVEADHISRELDAQRRTEADRQAAERLAAREIAIATQVQSGLFPQRRPDVATLDYAGICLQARQVGGDYFDFLQAVPGQVGLVVGDVSGKGIGAALLMANLQASIRSLYAQHPNDLASLLAVVNESFFESTPAASYATILMGTYDDGTREFAYVNAGHPPGLVLRSGGQIDTLDGTGTAVGLFERWIGGAARVTLGEGDVLVLYSDGVTEAVSPGGQEFGLARVIDELQAMTGRSAREQLDGLVSAVRAFTAGTPQDDVTVVVARGRSRTE